MTTIETNPAFICSLPSGNLFLSSMQFLRGYCILEACPEVSSINDLQPDKRTIFFQDITRVGDVLIKITGAYRINYAILGNSQPVLHAHIIPRYSSESEEYKHGLPWSYLSTMQEGKRFDPLRDKALILEIAKELS